jgi:protein-S-isoprenylcysteine O-methyltransferase Ste14
LIFAALAGFGLVHSLLASQAFKALARRWFGDRHTRGWYRLAYNGLAALTLLPALALTIALPDREVYRFPPLLAIAALGVQTLGALGVAYSIYQLDFPHFAGLRQLSAWLRRIETRSESDTSTSRLVVNGLHRYVRHPLYTSSLIVLWLISPMTVNRLAFVVGVTVYFYVGSIFEERKLVAEFGDAYRAYQQRVPRLLPRIRSRFTASS